LVSEREEVGQLAGRDLDSLILLDTMQNVHQELQLFRLEVAMLVLVEDKETN
jgi:hypothetical protein